MKRNPLPPVKPVQQVEIRHVTTECKNGIGIVMHCIGDDPRTQEVVYGLPEKVVRKFHKELTEIIETCFQPTAQE